MDPPQLVMLVNQWQSQCGDIGVLISQLVCFLPHDVSTRPTVKRL